MTFEDRDSLIQKARAAIVSGMADATIAPR
jgi:hypothetical protein